MEKGKIFISYRREDTSGESGRLKDNLEEIFGKENIFYDVETLEAGLNFDQSIAIALNDSKVLLAMIGPHWLRVTDSKGVKRLQNPDDWVRKEIAEALKRGLRVIPVLVNGADMPGSDELPEDLKELSMKHAQELTSSRWNYDVGVLSKVLEKLITKNPETIPVAKPEQSTPRSFVAPTPEPKPWLAKNYKWLVGGVLAFFVIYSIFPLENSESAEETYVENETVADDDSEIFIPEVSGNWSLTLEGQLESTFEFIQDGSEFTYTEINLEGNPVGEGSGQINGQDMILVYNSLVDDSKATMTLRLDDLEEKWVGVLSYPSTGDIYKSVLTRN